MATTREEVQIRLGVDAKALQMGLDSASGYMAKWVKKQSAVEKEYTSFWISELNKREQKAAEIKANYSNSIAAKDFSIAKQTEEKKAALMEFSAKTVSTKITTILKANLFFAVLNLIHSMMPDWDKYWSKAYGIDEAGTEKMNQALERIKKLREANMTGRDKLEARRRAAKLSSAAPDEKVSILSGEKTDTEAAIAKAQHDMDILDTKMRTSEDKSSEWHRGNVEERARLDNELNELLIKQIDLTEELTAAQVACAAAKKASMATPINSWTSAQLMEQMKSLGSMPFMGGLGGAIQKTERGVELFEAMHRQPLKVIIKGVDEP